MEKELERYFCKASGRVQGVGFRYFVQTNAQILGVTGWVKNMEDGTVTMEMQGTKDLLADLRGRIEKGTCFIKVNAFEEKQITVEESDTDFSIRYE